MAKPKLSKYRIITKDKVLKSFPPVLSRINHTVLTSPPSSSSKEIGAHIVRIRREDPLSIRVIITNEGARPAKVYEGGQMVLLAPAHSRLDLPGPGKLLLEALAIGGVTTVTAETFHRQAVGGPGGGDYLEPEVDPVGSWLL